MGRVQAAQGVAVLCAHRQMGGAATMEECVTVNKRSRRGSGALIAAATTGVLGVGLAAGPALAHIPAWAVTCTEVSVDLTNYSSAAENTVHVTVDGQDLLATETFNGEFHKKLELPPHDKELTVRLVVRAGDGDDHSRDETKKAPVCEDSTPTPPASPSPSATPTPSATPSTAKPTPSSPPSTATSSAAAPSATPSTIPGDLAETGSSSSTPLIAGAAAVVIVAGGGIVWAARKRRSTLD